MRLHRVITTVLLFCSFVFASSATAQDTGSYVVGKKDRCPVCGMFVAKYQNWWTRVQHESGKVHYFDGVKDLMAYYFTPQSFGGVEGDKINDVRVKDYYTQKWIDGKSAFYVMGSDVHGPMGHELVPHESMDAAQNFLQDHKGKKIVAFSEITPELIQSLRKGHMMKKHKMHSPEKTS